MNLLLTSVERLRRMYGEREARRIIAALEQLVQARQARGLRTQLLFAEPTAAFFADAAEVARHLLASLATLERAGDRVESLLGPCAS